MEWRASQPKRQPRRPVESDSDRLAILEAVGAEDVLVDSKRIRAVFETEFVEAVLAEEGVESSSPELTCRACDVPNVAHGSTVVARSVNYTVRGIQPDALGMVTLILRATT